MQGGDRALLVVTLVAGLASTIFMPFEAWLVGRLRWRGTLAALALILAAPTIPIHALMLRRPPRGRLDAATARAGAAVALLMLGAANGMATLARATTIAEIFGPRHYGSISGAMALGANGARAVAPFTASLLQVALGGYEPVFWLLAGALVLAGLGLLAAPTRIRRGGGGEGRERSPADPSPAHPREKIRSLPGPETHPPVLLGRDLLDRPVR